MEHGNMELNEVSQQNVSNKSGTISPEGDEEMRHGSNSSNDNNLS